MTDRAESVPSLRVAPWASPWLFFVVVFAWSWSFWIAAAVLGSDTRAPFGLTVELVGLLGPVLGGIGFTYLAHDRTAWRDYWVRIADPRRIPARWWLVIVLLAPCLWALAVVLDMLSGGAAPERIGQGMAQLFASPAALASLLLWTVLFGPIPEELGWRGYVLDRLQARWNALVASLILGAVWGLYHLPLFYMAGTYHAAQGPWSLWFWLFLVQVVPVTIVFTWIFNNTRRSTLAAILFHFMINLTAQLANLTSRTNVFVTVLWIVAAVVIVGRYGTARFVRGTTR